jgi:hypothetical protein
LTQESSSGAQPVSTQPVWVYLKPRLKASGVYDPDRKEILKGYSHCPLGNHFPKYEEMEVDVATGVSVGCTACLHPNPSGGEE